MAFGEQADKMFGKRCMGLRSLLYPTPYPPMDQLDIFSVCHFFQSL